LTLDGDLLLSKGIFNIFILWYDLYSVNQKTFVIMLEQDVVYEYDFLQEVC